jgi:hypothetical protein
MHDVSASQSAIEIDVRLLRKRYVSVAFRSPRSIAVQGVCRYVV